MQSHNTAARPPALTAASLPRILNASFVLQPDGQVRDPSDACLHLLGYAAADARWQLPDLMADAGQAAQLTGWLAASQGLSALSLETVLLRQAGDALAAMLWVTALPAGATVQALCVVQPLPAAAAPCSPAPQRERLTRAELASANLRLSALVASQQARLEELQCSQAALRALECRLKIATEGSGQGMWDWNLRTGDADFSPQCMRLLGYAEDGMPPRLEELRERVHPLDLDRALAEFKRCLQSDAPGLRMKFRMQCRDGSYVWMLSHGALAERDREGRPLRMIGTLKNINKRVSALQQLEQSEAKLRAITDNSHIVMFLKDLEGRYLHVNRRFEEVFGLLRGNVLGKADLEVFPTDMARQYRENDRRMLSTGQPYEVEEPAPSPDGTVHTYATIKIPLRDELDQIHAICGMATDITERQRMENDLRVAAVAFQTPIAIMVTDANQVIRRVNQAFVDSTGFSAEEVVGKTPRCLQAGKHDAAFYREMWRSIRETGSWQGEIWGRRRNKALYLKWLTISSVRDADGRISHYVGTESDISARKQAEQALQKLNRSLQENKEQLRELVAQNEAVRERERKHIAREVHDELGQTLTALRMDTSFIAMRFGAQDPDLQAKVLGMRTLVDQAIEGVRHVASNLRPTALDMGLPLALDWLCQDFTQHSGIACGLDCGDQPVELDEARAIVVFRIVQESLTNISRYAKASQVRVHLGLRGAELGLQVRDNGQGFEPQRAEQRKTFGLLGMRERALALGGRLDLVSAPGQGTTIALSIPYQTPTHTGSGRGAA